MRRAGRRVSFVKALVALAVKAIRATCRSAVEFGRPVQFSEICAG